VLAPAALLPGLLRPRILLPRNTLVTLELVQEISTSNASPDDFFELRVAEPVLLEGRVLIPAQARGQGQVVDAQGGGVFGSPAKLQLAIRYVEVDGEQLPLRFYQPMMGEDKSKQGMAMGMIPVVGLFAPFVHAGDIILPPGTRLIAKVAKDISIFPPSPPPDPLVPTATGSKQGAHK
jgi:hypothetical protein